jgi:hypothetical protein
VIFYRFCGTNIRVLVSNFLEQDLTTRRCTHTHTHTHDCPRTLCDSQREDEDGHNVENLCGFVFAGAKDFKKHMKEVHRSRKSYTASDHYLKSLVYSYLTATTRDESNRALARNRNR